MNAPHNIYIHVPYCISKCNYCAFFSRAIAPDWVTYAKNICDEVDYWAEYTEYQAVPRNDPATTNPDTYDIIAITHPAETEQVADALKEATWQSFGLHLGLKYSF